MTVREWIAKRTPAPPPSLTRQILAALGPEADAADARTAEVCLAAAARALEALLSANRFGRDSALALLTIDALTTYAYEHASEAADGQRLETLAEHGAELLGHLMTQRV